MHVRHAVRRRHAVRLRLVARTRLVARGRLAAAVTAACVAAGAIGVATVPANAVQTSRFGLAATGARSKILHPAQDRPIHDSVVVYNRTSGALSVSLDVVGVTHGANGSYALGGPGAGLAADVHLGTRSVHLPAKGRQVVPVTIDPQGDLRSPSYAAVTAVEVPATGPGVSVTERLAVLVGVTPAAAGGADHGSSGSSGTVRTIAVAVAVLLLLALLVTTFISRRRRSRNTAAAA